MSAVPAPPGPLRGSRPETPSRRARRRSYRAERISVRTLLVGTVLLDLLFVIGAVAAWPVFRTPTFLVAVAVGVAAAHVLAWVGLRTRISGWWLALATFGTYVVLGLPVAAPSMIAGGADQALRGLLGILTAPVTGWKDLLTLDLPVGSYQTVLAPAFLLWLAVPVAALSLAWRARRLWILAPLLALLLTLFGVLFGAPAVSAPLRWGTLVIPGPVELAVGAAAVIVALGFVVWRTLDERRRALRAAEAATGVRTTSRSGSALAGRVAISIGMVTAALAIGAVVTPLAVAGQPREVLRDGIDPRLEIAEQLSPLSLYRSFFTAEAYDTVLFTVATDADRVRLATLSFYDGRLARVVDPAVTTAHPSSAFVRVPAVLPAPAGTRAVSADVTVVDYDEIWMPTVGALTGVQFRGGSAAELADGFFYSRSAQMGVQLGQPGLGAGVGYRQTGAEPVELPSIAEAVPGRSTPQLPEEVVPESLDEWISAQDAPTGGAGLAELVDRLRARGYLSHAVAIDADDPPPWRAEQAGGPFEPSRAGHSTDRIDALFTALLERQNEVGGDDDGALVAAVGDDEQFAVATMMIADHFGFDARIVLGARLQDQGLPWCADGACRGGDVAAWVEVQDASGAWIPVDVTPQQETPPTPDDVQVRDPEVPTEVHDETAQQVLPGDADPGDSGELADDPLAGAVDWAAVWAAVRIAGIALSALLVVFGPFLLIVLAKAVRRRARRTAEDPTSRVVGGWDEYVDAAIDSGRDGVGTRTRQEVAAAHAAGDPGSRAPLLAGWADRSVFDAAPATPGDAERFWEIVDAERERLAASGGRWGRLRARLSLRSLAPRRRAGSKETRGQG